MKTFSAGTALALLAAPALVSASGTARVRSGPAAVPYVCDAGAASVVYESGSDYLHARARVTLDGHTHELRAAPTLFGVRYRSAPDDGTALAWTLRGEEAWLTESPDEDGYAGEERRVAHCTRLRTGSVASNEEGHGARH